jgi:UDP-N-acetylmuramoyl-tripeptide--D-alanyl-D-alanine ligase
MNLIPGIKNSFIIDDAYNASPASAEAALDILGKIKTVRKIAVMGDMLELGKSMESGHQKIAGKIFQLNPGFVFAVGDRMKIAVKELKLLGYPADRIFHFDDPIPAGKKLQKEIKEGDLILIKGSQAMRMEKIVEEIMSNPQEAENILCRQSSRPYQV